MTTVWVCACTGHGPSPREAQSTPPQDLHLQIELPESQAGLRATYADLVHRAESQVAEFFRKAGFSVLPEELIDTVIVVDWTANGREQLAQRFAVTAAEIPETFSGTTVGRSLYLVTRERYRENWSTLYRDWAWTDTAYYQLVVHELTHRAHEAIALSQWGTADRMGPAWFFEGLAVMCAGQFDAGAPALTQAEIDAQVGGGRTPEVSYPLYGRLVRSLATTHGLKLLIESSSVTAFPDTMSEGR
jgi:hypothetical protein